jgi:hypothetical protein
MLRRALAVCSFILALCLSLSAHAEGRGTRAQMAEEVHGYYAAELRSGFIFMGAGTVHAGTGVYALTQSGDFAKSYGWTSVILGGLTFLGGGGYALTVIPRGNHFESLFEQDRAKFESEEAEHIAGTNGRFVFYLGFEITETLAGAGVLSYGLIKDKDTYKGIGLGAAIQGLSLFAIDLPGALRAKSYEKKVRSFDPTVAFAVGDAERPWLVTLSQRF